MKGKTNLYRGLKLASAELDNYKEGNLINLTGFTSSSMDKNVAIKFAIENEVDDQTAVVFHIKFKGK